MNSEVGPIEGMIMLVGLVVLMTWLALEFG